jgi:hypothetical protein
MVPVVNDIDVVQTRFCGVTPLVGEAVTQGKTRPCC